MYIEKDNDDGSFYDFYTFKNGKHKGRTISEIIKGPSEGYLNYVQEYLSDLFDVYLFGTFKKVYFPSIGPAVSKIRPFVYSEVKIVISTYYIKIIAIQTDNDNDWLTTHPDYNGRVILNDKYGLINSVTEAILNLLLNSFTNDLFKFYEIIGNGSLTKSSVAIKSDGQYISWAIRNMGKFVIKPHVILKKYSNIECCDLVAFEAEKIGFGHISYSPIFKKFNFRFDENIIKFNNNKYYELFKREYDIDNDYYIVHNDGTLNNQ